MKSISKKYSKKIKYNNDDNEDIFKRGRNILLYIYFIFLIFIFLLLIYLISIFFYRHKNTNQSVLYKYYNKIKSSSPLRSHDDNSIIEMKSISNTNIKIIDSFMFNDEPMAFLRMIYLKDVVDIFVITEMKTSFSGIYKNSYYMNKYEEFFQNYEKQGKLIRIYTEKFPYLQQYTKNIGKYYYESHSMWDLKLNLVKDKRMLPFARERYLRDFPIKKIINRLNNSKYILLINDPDELPSIEFIKSLPGLYYNININGAIRLDMPSLYYNFKWQKKNSRVNRAIAISSDYLNNNPDISVNDMRFFNDTLSIYNSTGWHCSYCTNTYGIINKIKSFSHQEYNKREFTNHKWIKNCVKNGIDLYNRTSLYDELTIYNGLEGYPKCNDCTNKKIFKHLNIPNFIN